MFGRNRCCVVASLNSLQLDVPHLRWALLVHHGVYGDGPIIIEICELGSSLRAERKRRGVDNAIAMRRGCRGGRPRDTTPP